MTRCFRRKSNIFGFLLLALALNENAGAVSAESYVKPYLQEIRQQVQQEPREGLRSKKNTMIDLGLWSKSEGDIDEEVSESVFQISTGRKVVATDDQGKMLDQFQWETLENGSSIASVTYKSGGALGIRLGLLVQAMPFEAKFRIFDYNKNLKFIDISGMKILSNIGENKDAGDKNDASRTWWSPEIPSDAIAMEIELPPGIPPEDLKFSIPSIQHTYINLSNVGDILEEQAGNAAACNLDASCYDEFDPLRNAVARMIYVKDGKGYTCTGTLVNDLKNSGIPYFLTANHCINSQTVASSLQTQWFYKSSACNAKSVSFDSKVLNGGATLLYTSSSPDVTLLRLNEEPPVGAVFAGWDTASDIPYQQNIFGVHHPRGDILKLSSGNLKDYYNCTPFDTSGATTCYQSDQVNAKYFNVAWNLGTTEPGSSGSGAFRDGKLIGILSAGNGACGTAGHTIYSRFSVAYDQISAWLGEQTRVQPNNATNLRKPVYRFFDSATGTHFLTINSQERDEIIRKLPTYKYEGVPFYVSAQPSEGLVSVARFFNKQTAAHFFTAVSQERDALIAKNPVFSYEGSPWYSSTKNLKNEMKAVHRFYRKDKGVHFYTASEAEKDYILKYLPMYHYDGSFAYVWSKP